MYSLQDTIDAVVLVAAEVDKGKQTFLYQQQRAAATRVFVINYDALTAAVAELQDREGDAGGSHVLSRIVLLHSTGRCGSTLLSKLLGRGQGVVSLSEPDVYSVAVVLRHDGTIDNEHYRTVLRAATWLLGRSNGLGGGATPGSDVCYVALKFRSFVTGNAVALRDAIPEAKVCTAREGVPVSPLGDIRRR